MTARAFIRSLILTVCVAAAPAAMAQDGGATVASPVLVVDSDRVFLASRAGRRISDDLETRLAALAAENRKIEADLTAEELELTQTRETMAPAEFRALADAFDEKVQAIRASQDAKQRELQQLRDSQNQIFLEQLAPILSGIGRERGALVILERRTVLLSADSIDITDQAISRINAMTSNDAAEPDTAPTQQPQTSE